MKAGPPLQTKILPLSELQQKVAQWKGEGHTVAFTNGCFDILHAGHIASLTEAAAQGDKLIVALNADLSVKGLKGDSRPVNNQEARALVMAALSMVDAVIIFSEPTPLDVIIALQPDVLVKGGDYKVEDIAGAKEVIERGGRVVINPIIEGFSTTAIIEKIAPPPPAGGLAAAQPTASPNPSKEGLSNAQPTPVNASHDSQEDYTTADPMTYGLLKEFVREHRSRPTQAESILWEQLRGKQVEGHKFRRQHIVGNYIADFISLKNKLIIEVDGLIHQLPENIASDEERTKRLNKRGYQVIRFTNEQVIKGTKSVLSQILLALKNVNNNLASPQSGASAVATSPLGD